MITDRIMPRLRLARIQFKHNWRDYRELQREYSIWGEVARFKEDVKECLEKGKVYTEGVSDEAAKEKLDKARQPLESWAKVNGLNVVFYTPTGKGEYGASSFEKPLHISVQKNGFFSWGASDRVIDGDTDKVIRHVSEKPYTINKQQKTMQLDAEEPFLRRVCRTVKELKEEVNNK